MAVDVEQPLLEKKRTALVHPNCSGCKCSYLQNADAPIPWKFLFYLAALTLVNALPISSLYPFLYFMVRDFHVAKTEKDIGFYAGYIGSAFMVGRFLTSFHWGIASDKFGRVPVMVIGVVSVFVFNLTVVFTLILSSIRTRGGFENLHPSFWHVVIVFHTTFGLSTTLWMAVLSRFLLGSCNGMLGTVRAYASEVCSARHQALSASIVGTIWGLGLIIGPAMGGYLSQPAIKYPNLFPPGSLFDRYAYLLPSLLVTALAIPTLFVTLDLPETLHNHDIEEVEKADETKDEHAAPLPTPRLALRLGSRKYSACEGIDSPTLLSPFGSLHDSTCDDELQRSGRRRSHNFDSFQFRSNSSRSRRDDEDECQDVGDGYKGLPVAATGVQENQAESANVEEETKRLATSEREPHHYVKKKKSSFLSKPVMGSIALYCIWSLHDMAYTEIFSLWCVSPRANGGLGLSTTNVGQILAISGFSMLLFQLFVFAPVVNLTGSILISQISAVGTVLLMVAYPPMTMLHGATLGVVLSILSIVKNILGVMIFTASFILLNKSAAADQRATVNGLAMSLVSLFKGIGPAGGGSIFAWAQRRQSHILPGNQLVFFSLGLVAFLSFLCTLDFILPHSIEKQPVEDVD